MMKRRILLLFLALCLGLAACQSQVRPTDPAKSGGQPAQTDPAAPVPSESELPTEQTETQPAETEPEPGDLPADSGLGLSELDSRLISFLREGGLGEKSFTVSPLSYKAALALTALGAEGETLEQLLTVLGFETVDQLTAWYATVLQGVGDFDSRIFGEDRDDSAYRVVNAIFRNADYEGDFRETYRDLVSRALAADAHSAPAEELTKAVNDWVNEQTHGMIPDLVQDVSEASAVLVNALYLKTKWIEAFDGAELTDFTTLRGQTVQKEFITHTDHYDYYADEDCQLVVLPLQGGVDMVLILGDGTNLAEKLSSVTYRKVHVTLPKFEVETSLENKELVKFLQAMDCGRMFWEGNPDFDPMFTEAIHVDDIVQKAKVKVDENGLEAAAATAVVMVKNTAMPNPEEPVDFTADRPFQFCILRQDEAPELLFWGQIVD